MLVLIFFSKLSFQCCLSHYSVWYTIHKQTKNDNMAYSFPRTLNTLCMDPKKTKAESRKPNRWYISDDFGHPDIVYTWYVQGQRNHRNDFAWKYNCMVVFRNLRDFLFISYEIDFNWRNHENHFVNLVYYLKVAMEMCQMIWLGQSTNLLYQFKFFFHFVFFFALPVWKFMVYSLRSIIFGTALKSILFFVICIVYLLLFENSVRPMMIFEEPNQFVIEDWSIFMNF